MALAENLEHGQLCRRAERQPFLGGIAQYSREDGIGNGFVGIIYFNGCICNVAPEFEAQAVFPMGKSFHNVFQRWNGAILFSNRRHRAV